MTMRVRGVLGATILLVPLLSACQGSVTLSSPSSSPTTAPAPDGSLTASPAPASSPTASAGSGAAGGGDDAAGDVGDPVSGATDIGPLGDPCALLSKSDIEDALGVTVIGIARGKLGADEGQSCAYAVDAPGVTSGLPPNLGLDPSEGTLGPFMVAFEKAGKGGVFGVRLVVVDPKDIDTSDSGDEPDPEMTATKVPIGSDGVVAVTPNGGMAMTWDGIRRQIILMDLITGTPDVDALTDLLRTAYGQL